MTPPAAYCPPGKADQARNILEQLGESYAQVVETPAVTGGILLAGALIRVIPLPEVNRSPAPGGVGGPGTIKEPTH